MRLDTTLYERTPPTVYNQNIGVNNEILRDRIREVEDRILQMKNTARETHHKTQKRIKVALTVAACSAVLISIRLIALYFNKS